MLQQHRDTTTPTPTPPPPPITTTVAIIIIALIGAFFISIFPNQLKPPQRWKLFEACCYFNAKNHYPTISIYCNYISTFILLSSKCMLGLFMFPAVIHRTLTWTTWYLTCVRDHSDACVYTRGVGTPTASQQNIFDSEKLTFFLLCSWWDSNLGHVDLESEALPTEPPCHPNINNSNNNQSV